MPASTYNQEGMFHSSPGAPCRVHHEQHLSTTQLTRLPIVVCMQGLLPSSQAQQQLLGPQWSRCPLQCASALYRWGGDSILLQGVPDPVVSINTCLELQMC
jgi:hypothetical protein